MQADVTQLLQRWSEGDQEALGRLFPLLYDRLKRLAHGRLNGERAGHTLSTTGLVHEAYLKLVDIDRVQWEDRQHFLAMASRVMRRVLVDHARERRALKRGGGAPVDVLDEEWLMPEREAERLLDIDDALQQLESAHPRKAKAVELRFSLAWLARAWDAGTQPPRSTLEKHSG